LSKNVVGIEFEPRTLTREKQFTEDVTSECCNEFAKAQILILVFPKKFSRKAAIRPIIPIDL
jgi:hypothetical protein